MTEKVKSRIRVYGFLLVIAIAVAGYVFLSRGSEPTKASADTKTAAKTTAKSATPTKATAEPDKKKEDQTPVELFTVQTGDISSYLSATANLRAGREVQIASRTEGVVREVAVEEGDFVQNGQVLCSIDDTELKINQESARQRLAQAKLQLEKARIRQDKAAVQIKNTQEELKRYEALYANKLVSESEVAQLRYKMDELRHDEKVSLSETRELTHRVEELESENAQIALNLELTRIKAPFSGYIVERTVEVGRNVRSLESLFKLSDFTPLYADVHLSEAEARRVHPGQEAIITLGVDETAKVTGRIARISPVVDQASGTVKVTIELPKISEGFKPGAFVRVSIQTDRREDALLIPKRAILEEDNDQYVFIANGQTAKRQIVRVGYQQAGNVEVRAGLIAGQKIVVAGQGALKDGARIQVVDRSDLPTANAKANRIDNKVSG